MLGLRLPTRKTGRVYIRGVFTEEEAERLSQHHMLYRLSLATGLRLGELRKLSDENKRIIHHKLAHGPKESIASSKSSMFTIPSWLMSP